ncbi:mechanosensitive ion channel family protein [Bacillus sp. FJAT-50079]|uniref:mechanosensitive ion channel family protein n=1 Tax=Bacillus sp. FJAT-50079 TaxID=2833577 RepID=UPI001BC8DF24|nr:mechanosensitive ion channel family protein [Bacillus sp. FJAT-50079]MBS4207159.1 mechanosensitive ion channel family protein [Bacillus sp. FJAT-50079]
MKEEPIDFEELSWFREKLMDTDMWLGFGWKAVKIILIIILAGAVIRIGRSMIGNILKGKRRNHIKMSERRENTLVKLLQNIVTYVVSFIAIVTILSTLTIDITGLLAGAGILGLAVGFGAQSLVKDVLSGFFIIFEDQFSVGDEVQIGEFEGTVQEIGLRTTKILHWTGKLFILPNGSITNVTNLSVFNSTAVIDYSISYEGDIHKVEAVINQLLQTMPNKYEELLSTPKLLGIEQVSGSDLVFRITAETIPSKHWYIERQVRRELKIGLDAQLPESQQEG